MSCVLYVLLLLHQMWKDHHLSAVCCFGWTEVLFSQLSPPHGDI